MNRREFHFAEGTSSKFWAVSVAGGTLTCQFGRIGSAGQTQHKPFATEAEANVAAEKLIAEKTRKGYQEVVAAGAPVEAPIVREVALPRAVPGRRCCRAATAARPGRLAACARAATTGHAAAAGRPGAAVRSRPAEATREADVRAWPSRAAAGGRHAGGGPVLALPVRHHHEPARR
ncbi:MAG: WGR domain-containing protein [Gemmataceae bacterium]